MALSFIGKPISLISHSDVRYRGILAGIDPQASTIQLSNVFSMGTESRRPPADFIPPVQEPYEYIIFRASEVKDLSVDEPTPRRSVHDDPAVLGASQPSSNYFSRPPQPQQPSPPAQPETAPRPGQQGRRSTGSLHTAAASLETVERAIGDLRVSSNNNNNGGGRRNGVAQQRREQIKVPSTDFDFQSSNARFDKGALASNLNGAGGGGNSTADDDVDTNPSDSEEKEKEREKEKKKPAYNPQKSFFDSLTPGPGNGPRGGGGGGGRGGRGRGGRNRREEERERNVATFGEPGGVGLMGPGAYVGGWGGYGRRGGRPRRGGGPVGAR